MSEILEDKAQYEFEFSSKDFDRVKSLIYERAGISLNSSKRTMVYSRLARRLRVLGIGSFSSYLDKLESGLIDEWEHFINALTTNLTSFYRESHHFEVLADLLKTAPRGQTTNIWCSAASTGEEPYTLAITALEVFGKNPPVRILATDIDTNVLTKANQGVYDEAGMEKVPDQIIEKYFLKGKNANAGKVMVRPEVKELITFRQLNLLSPSWPMKGPFHVIFCRNVMIYFDKPTQRKILEKMAPLFTADGHLFAGHSESFAFARDLFDLQEKTVYQLSDEYLNRFHQDAQRLRKMA